VERWLTGRRPVRPQLKREALGGSTLLTGSQSVQVVTQPPSPEVPCEQADDVSFQERPKADLSDRCANAFRYWSPSEGPQRSQRSPIGQSDQRRRCKGSQRLAGRRGASRRLTFPAPARALPSIKQALEAVRTHQLGAPCSGGDNHAGLPETCREPRARPTPDGSGLQRQRSDTETSVDSSPASPVAA
jgi:hypothetical protein